jgi:hypothetical protein
MTAAVTRARRHLALRRGARRLGLHVVVAGAYSPIPDWEAFPAEHYERAAPMPGVDLRLDAGLALLREHAALLAEPPGTSPHNPFFGPVDCEVAHALVRAARPRRIVELGSGHSTRVLARAAPGAEHHVIDPSPSPLVPPGVTVDARPVEAVGDEPFAALEASDLLFVDTSHTVRPGGDVNRIVLEVLPALAPGVLVHVHDVFRPYEYPSALHALGAHWQEQYLVQALLCGNDGFEVVLACHALWREHREEVEALVPSARRGALPSSLWLRRV